MADEYADAVVQFTDDIDRAVMRATEMLSRAEIVDELRRAADAWEEEQ